MAFAFVHCEMSKYTDHTWQMLLDACAGAEYTVSQTDEGVCYYSGRSADQTTMFVFKYDDLPGAEWFVCRDHLPKTQDHSLFDVMAEKLANHLKEQYELVDESYWDLIEARRLKFFNDKISQLLEDN